MDVQNLRNLLDFFISCGIDEAVEDNPTNYYDKKKNDPIITIKTVDSPVNIAKNNSLSDITEKLLENVSDITEIKNQLMNFENDLKKYCINTVWGRGNENNPTVLVLGEIPNSDSDKSGVAYDGAIGELLDKMLGAIELSGKTNTFMSYLFPYKTPGNRLPTMDELAQMLPFVKKMIAILKPKLIISLGERPLNILTGNNFTISKNHGEVVEFEGIKVVAIHDPEILLLDGSKKKIVWEDLKSIRGFI